MSKIFTKAFVEKLLTTPEGRMTLKNALKQNNTDSEDIKFEIFVISETFDVEEILLMN